MAEIAVREQLPLIAYSPLAGGLLTGKYGGAPVPISGSRSDINPKFLAGYAERRMRAVAAYAELARRCGLPLAAMALALARQQPFTGAVLMAASGAEQLASNLAAVDVKLSKPVIKAINAIHDDYPNPR